MKSCDDANSLYGSDFEVCKVFPVRSFPRFSRVEGSLDFDAPSKVARQLLAVVRSPQKINVCAMAGRNPNRHDGGLLVKHLPPPPVRVGAGGPALGRGVFSPEKRGTTYH